MINLLLSYRKLCRYKINKSRQIYSFKILLAAVAIISAPNVFAQTCGFGCLGLSGIYGGYTYQTYNADPILQKFQSSWAARGIPDQDLDFNKAVGIRVGANIIRAQFSGVFIGLKGFYQFMNSKNEFDEFVGTDKILEKYDLKLDYWGVGMDFGFGLIRNFLDIKLVEAVVTFHSVKLTWQSFISDNQNFEMKFKSPELEVSYYAGSGVIIHLIPDYISLEGTAFMSFFELSELIEEDTDLPFLPGPDKLLSQNKISYSVHLNLGFPL